MTAKTQPADGHTRIGKHRIVGLIHRSSHASLLHGYREDLGQTAAIKLLDPQQARSPFMKERFYKEARAANLVRHAAAVPVFEIDATPDGTPYFVMPLLEGETMERRCASQAPTDWLPLFQQSAEVLEAAHRSGVIHRDVNPSNLVITPDPVAPGGLRARLIDFGIARLLPEIAVTVRPRRPTPPGSFLGTPTYMAPEQFASGEADAKADVYSLGATMYRVLAGRPPFQEREVDALLLLLCFAPPGRLRDLSPEVPRRLNDLVMSMLAKAPQERPGMAEVAARLASIITERTRAAAAQPEDETLSWALQTAVDEAPAEEPAPTPTPRPRRRPRRWLAGPLAFALALLALALAPRLSTERAPRRLTPPAPQHAEQLCTQVP